MTKIVWRLLFLTIALLGSEKAFSQFIPFGFFKIKPDKIAFTTSTQSILAGNCSGASTVQYQTAGGAAKNVTADLTIPLDPLAGMTFYSDQYCLTAITDITITTGNNSASFYFISSTIGARNISLTYSASLKTQQSQTISTNSFVWTGGGGNALWSTAGNWSGGAAPGATDRALFDTTCAANCSPNISASINVGGVRLSTGYAGTITQAGGSTITAGSGGWVQAAGSFVGSSSGDAITINGNVALAAGSFKATSGNTSMAYSLFVSGTPSFDANGGTVVFTAICCGAFGLTPGSIAFNHVTFNSYNVPFALTGTMTVGGNLAFNNTGGVSSINGGTINASGDVTVTNWNGGTSTLALVGSGTQTLTGTNGAYVPSIKIASTGTVNLDGTIELHNMNSSFDYTSGTIAAGTSALKFNTGCGTSNITIAGASHFNDVSFGVSSCSANTYNITGTLSVDGTLKFENSGGTGGSVNGGTIKAYGDVTGNGFGGSSGGTTVVSVEGTSPQTITGTASTVFPSLTIASGDTVVFSGVIKIGGGSTYNYVGGTLIAGTSTLYLTGGCLTTTASNAAFEAYYDLTIKNSSCTSENFVLSGAFRVSHNLTLDNGSGAINGGVLEAQGDVSILGATGSVQLSFTGSSQQTVTGNTTNTPSGDIAIDNGAGILLATDMSWNGGSQTIDITSGDIWMAGHNLTLHAINLNGLSITKGGGVLKVNGSTIGTGSFFGGTINP